MDLAPWRDLAIILLVIEAVVIVAVPGILFYFLLKGVRAVKRFVRTLLLQAQVWAMRIQKGTVQATDAVAEVPIRMVTAGVRARATARGVTNYLLGR